MTESRGERIAEERKRFNDREKAAISIVKSILMLAVVYIHSNSIPNLGYPFEREQHVQRVIDIFSEGFLEAAVPVFFVISSFLLYTKQFIFAENLKKKWRTLVIPYLLINTLWIVVFGSASLTPVRGAIIGTQYEVRGVKGFFDAYLGIFERSMPLYYPFWFLKDLILLNLLAVPIGKLVDRFPILTGIGLLAAYGFGVHFIIASSYILFWSEGCYLAKYYGKCRDVYSRINFKLATLLYLAVFMLYSIFGINFLSFQVILFGVEALFLCKLSGMLIGTRCGDFLLWFSGYSFFVYAFHEYMEAFLKRGIMSILPQTAVIQILEYILLPVFVVSICLVTGKIARTWMPKLYALVCGGR